MENGADFEGPWRLGLDFGLWGKSEGLPPGVVYPLVWHLLDTAAVAWWVWELHLSASQRGAFVSGVGLDPGRAGDRERARRLLACWAGWHDIGKITELFQAKDLVAASRLSGYSQRGPDDSRASHGWATHLALAGSLPSMGYDAAGDDVGPVSPARRVAQLLGGHHGRFFAQPLRREVRHAGLRDRWLGGGKWEQQRRAHAEAVAAVTGRPTAPRAVGPVAAVLAGEVVVLADWLASQSTFVTAQLNDSGGAEGPLDVPAHWSRAFSAAPGLLAEAGLGLPEWKATPRS